MIYDQREYNDYLLSCKSYKYPGNERNRLIDFSFGEAIQEKDEHLTFFCFIKMVADCGATFAKYLLCLFNFIFFIVGSAVICIGVWLAIDKTSFIQLTKFSQLNNEFETQEEVRGIIRELTEPTFLGVLWSNQRVKDCSHCIGQRDAVTITWDFMMAELHCCGVDNSEDFRSAVKFMQMDDQCTLDPTPLNSYMKQGCFNVINDWISSNLRIVIGVAIGKFRNNQIIFRDTLVAVCYKLENIWLI
ncbi:unnamed protein product [Lepeophtheirus salmonis]|uniref:(salmon louse) hypothetical protein n=1 Tax=Lepeophtheirus salmonis TaxID=72036 RepID=A0A7R8CT47_LEPSM|nr:unnamed protein product [Lepeophtheirus salmonis]CAF2885469.1 unnamed protein product [Lepeophtheirus salmonis]